MLAELGAYLQKIKCIDCLARAWGESFKFFH
jgi:hypothetical protein